MAKKIAVVNQKGGVAKTTTSINLSAGLAREGYRVLVVDTDPQSDTTMGCGIDPEALPNSLYDLILAATENRQFDTKSAIYHHTEGFDILPNTLDTGTLEINMWAAVSRETIIRRIIEPVNKDYDFIILDCPPSLGVFTINSLTAADKVLVPAQPAHYSVKGINNLSKTVDTIKRMVNPNLEIMGILITMERGNTNNDRRYGDFVRDAFGSIYYIYPDSIPLETTVPESQSVGKSIYTHDPRGKAAESYRRLVADVIRKSMKGEMKNVEGYGNTGNAKFEGLN